MMGIPKRLGAPLLLPPRSHLYSLIPCAVGHPEVESVTSYLNRLARAYHVPALSLLSLLTERTKLSMYRSRNIGALSVFGKSEAMMLNEVESSLLPWIESLQVLTGQDNLHALTIRKWGGEYCGKIFLRKEVAWCPQCYHEWRVNKQIIYQPLLWMMANTTMCIRHQQRLIDRCKNPACGRSQRVLQMRTMPPGCCMWCGTWLGENSQEINQDQYEQHWNKWFYHAVEELVNLPKEAQHWDKVISNLARVADHLGGIVAWAKLMGVRAPNLRRWIGMEKRVPSLLHLFRVCYAVGHTPKEFMEEHIAINGLVVCQQYWVQPGVRRVKTQAYMKRTRTQVKHIVLECLEGKQHWVSVNHLARIFAISPGTVSRWYPSEIAELTRRREILLAQDLQKRIDVVRREVLVLLQAAESAGKILGREKATALVSYPSILLDPKYGRVLWREARKMVLKSNDEQYGAGVSSRTSTVRGAAKDG